MKQEFVPYDLAAKLKELGFDEPCFGFYYIKEINLFESCKINERRNSSYIKDYMSEEDCSAPTFSQAFRWLLEEHNLYAIIIPTITMNWTFKTMTVVEGMIEVPPYKHVDAYDYSTRKEAELACLTNLIEIVESKSE
jgi:hypothetical protein